VVGIFILEWREIVARKAAKSILKEQLNFLRAIEFSIFCDFFNMYDNNRIEKLQRI
jgi:hypothetical protein